MKMRLQKALAEAGLASRRASEDLITAGRVTVDGLTAELGASADPETQVIAVDGRPIAAEVQGILAAQQAGGRAERRHRRPGTAHRHRLVPTRARVFPVGGSTWTAPAWCSSPTTATWPGGCCIRASTWRRNTVVTVRGVVQQGGPGGAAARGDAGGRRDGAGEGRGRWRSPGRRRRAADHLTIVLHEGRKRQVRRMMEAVGHRVVALHRTRFDGSHRCGAAARPGPQAVRGRNRQAPQARRRLVAARGQTALLRSRPRLCAGIL